MIPSYKELENRENFYLPLIDNSKRDDLIISNSSVSIDYINKDKKILEEYSEDFLKMNMILRRDK